MQSRKVGLGAKSCRVGGRVNILKHQSYMSDEEGKKDRERN